MSSVIVHFVPLFTIKSLANSLLDTLITFKIAVTKINSKLSPNKLVQNVIAICFIQ